MPSVLVLAPTRELCQQTADACERLRAGLGASAAAVAVACVVGGVEFDAQREALAARPPRMLVATPGRLLSLCGEVPASTRARALQQGKGAPRSMSLGHNCRLGPVRSLACTPL